MISPKANALVTRNNNIIEGRYTLTLQEQRIVLWLISEINPDDVDFRDYRVSVSKLAEFLCIEKNKNIYKECAEFTKKLLRRVIEVAGVEGNTLLQVGWISKAKYYIGKGYVDISFDPELKPYLLQQKGKFTTIALRYAIALSSVYAVRIYDLCKQYQTIGDRTITINDLKRILDIQPDQYTEYKNFKLRVITIALREINAKTDIFVSYIEHKDGRRVGSLTFTIRSKTAAEDAAAEAPPADGERVQLARRLVALGMSEAEAARMLDTYQTEDPERVPWHLDELVRLEKAGGGRIKKTPLAWIRWAVKEDLREQRPLASSKAKDAVAREKEAIKGRIARLTTGENAAYRQEFEREVAAGKLGKLQKSRFDQSGWNSETTKRAWLKFMAGKLGVACGAL